MGPEKTTTINCLGFVEPAGSAKIKGLDVRTHGLGAKGARLHS